MCGPPAMMKVMADGFGKLGVPKAHIRWEEFNVR
jgi:ferredoxin-NADP reductase